MNHIEGLIAAPFTPFEKDGALKLEVVKRQVDLLVNSNVKGAFVGGTTGEAMSLTIQERKQLAQQWMEESPSDFKVMVQCGHTALTVCKEIAGHAREIGAYGVGAMGPFFYKPISVKELVSFTREIASVTPDLPFYYYHIPSMTGLNFQMIEYLEIASQKIPNLAGIKFTHEDLVDFKLCSEYMDGKYEMLYGRDETLLCGLALGARGAIGSTYNYNAPIYNRIIKAWDEKDIERANEMQHKVMQFVRILNKYGGGIVAGKAIMKLVGVDCGPVRHPLNRLSESEIIELEKELEAIDFFELLRIES